MTDNQQKAKKYLDRYREGTYDLKRLGRRLNELRERTTSIRSSLNVQEGWTGAYDAKGDKIMVPISVSKSPDVQSKVLLLDAVVFQSVEYDQKEIELIELCTELENTIDNALGLCVEGTILKYRYIDMLRYEEIAVLIEYSYRQTRRLHWQGLERLGEKLAPNVL